MRKAPTVPAISIAACLWLTACDLAGNPSLPSRAAAAPAAQQIIDADVALVGVSVIPMTSNTVLSNQTVLVKDGTIVALGRRGEIVPDAGAAIVNGTGRYLMPGLADMHVHIDEEGNFLPLVAYGVTFIRNMWGMPQHLEWRAKIESGDIVGPRMMTSGPIVDGADFVWAGSAIAASPADARRIMDEQKAAGYDFIKIYQNLAPDSFDAVAAYSKLIDLPFAGHVPGAVPLERALVSGMQTMEHLWGWNDAVAVPGSRFAQAASTAGKTPAQWGAGLAEIGRDLNTGRLAWSDLVNADRRAHLASRAAGTGTWQVPTLITLEHMHTSRRQAEVQFGRPETRFVSPAISACWHPDANALWQELTDDQLEALHFLTDESSLQVTELHRAGARILVGTDAPNPVVPFGYSVHEELELLVGAGLSPYEALVAATRAPAEFVQDGSFGTVEVGKRADLVLLNANPLENIAASKNIAGVMLRGRWLPEWELTSMLDAMVGGFSTDPVTCPFA